MIAVVLSLLVCLGAPRPGSLDIPRIERPLPGAAGVKGPMTGTDASRTTVLHGRASWYAAPAGTAAAGPALRHGDWRGSRVTVCAGRCVTVDLVDFCQCYRGTRHERLLDLSASAFQQLAPLSQGIVEVVLLAPPATDSEEEIP